MRHLIALCTALCMLFAVCSLSAAESAGTIVSPLPDATMDNLTDAILSVSFAEGDVYLDDTGKLQMLVSIYTCDLYDLVDISLLKAGDTLMTHSGEMPVVTLAHTPDGVICVNDSVYLTTDDCGLYYAVTAEGEKDWYEIGRATLRVSVDFEGHDLSDPALGEVIFYPGSFLVNEVTDYRFTPWNTTIRVESNQVVELHRSYRP